jgi:hypothetical protein
VLPWFDNRKKELVNRPLIREQAFGEALEPAKLEGLGRYEIHLDRKLERMLSILMRLKELRRPDATEGSVSQNSLNAPAEQDSGCTGGNLDSGRHVRVKL